MARVSFGEGIFTLCVFAACWLCSLQAAAATAATVPLELVWNAPASNGCPTAEALVQQVAALVERQSSSAHAVRAAAQVEQVAKEHYRVRLTTESQGARGSRVLEEHSCQALGNVVVLILAWMLQPDLSRTEAVARADDPRPSPAPQSARQDLQPRPFQSGAAEWQLSLGAIGDLGSLPRGALGGLVALAYRKAPFQLALQGSYFPGSRGEVTKVAGFSATGGEFLLGAVSLLGCFEPTPARFGLCLGPELDHERGHGFGVSSPGAGSKSWLSLAGGLRSTLHLAGRWWLQANCEAVVPTQRESFVLHGVGAVHRPSALITRASLGLGFTL